MTTSLIPTQRWDKHCWSMVVKANEELYYLALTNDATHDLFMALFQLKPAVTAPSAGEARLNLRYKFLIGTLERADKLREHTVLDATMAATATVAILGHGDLKMLARGDF